jgi:phosphoglycerate dehydrogenase-like enzyme
MNHLLISKNAIKSKIIIEKLSKKFDIEFFERNLLFKKIANLEKFSIWIHFDTLITDRLMNFQDQLQFLITTTTSTTHISPRFYMANQEKIISLKPLIHKMNDISSTAEHAWALMMTYHHKILEANNSVKLGEWNRDKFIRRSQIRNSTIGIIGLGRLGNITKNYAEAFGANVVVNEINDHKKRSHKFKKIKFLNLNDLLEQSDYVFLHASTAENANPIINNEILSEVKNPFVLINTSRGRLVDEGAILKFLKNGLIRAYLTDVLEIEDEKSKITNSKLITSKNHRNKITITPHIGGASLDAMYYCENLLYQELTERFKR